MYSCTELKELTLNLRINDITLELLREFYETFLHPFEYHIIIIVSLPYSKAQLPPVLNGNQYLG